MMTDNSGAARPFAVYEYRDAAVDARYASHYMDGYANFGWQIDEGMRRMDMTGNVVLHMKRDRRIVNRMELTRLQRQFEACMAEIRSLEHSRNSQATAASLIVGVVGTAFMAGSVFAVTAQPPIVWLCVLLAIPGFALWGLALPTHRRILRRRAEAVEPLIEAKYDEICTLLEKGDRLIHS